MANIELITLAENNKGALTNEALVEHLYKAREESSTWQAIVATYKAEAMNRLDAGKVPHVKGNPVHRNCPNCRLQLMLGASFTALPCSETYFSS